jgi:hypothetical protein
VDCISASRADFRFLADATCTLWALRASGESQCKPDGAEQDSEAKPQAAVCASVAGNDSCTDAEEKPDYDDELHEDRLITLYGLIVKVYCNQCWGQITGTFRMTYSASCEWVFQKAFLG